MFTKGEWKVKPIPEDQSWAIISESGSYICEILSTEDDANLIAQAPDMYEALKAFVVSENVLKRIGYANEIEKAKKAIAGVEK